MLHNQCCDTVSCSASGGRRQGYMGHLTHMVNSIRKWYEERATLKELVQSSEYSVVQYVLCLYCATLF